MSSGYNEQALSPDAQNIHRALASLQEELEAVDYYNQRMDRSEDAALKAVLEHNRNEEMEHAAMLFEWLRRKLPPLDATMKTYLFTTAPITEIEAVATGTEAPASPATDGSLGLGKLA